MPTTRSSVSTSPRWRSTDPSTKPEVEGKELVPTPPIGDGQAGSGRSPRRQRASPSAGRVPALSVTTRCSSNRRLGRSGTGVCSRTSRPCTSIVAMTRPSPGTGSCRLGITDALIGKRRKAGTAAAKRAVPLGLRWPVERTNSWLSNFGQLRRNSDRKLHHRLAQFALAIVFLITAKLIDWRNRWCPDSVPIR